MINEKKREFKFIPKQRFEIIHNNFFKYLNDRKISFAKYAEDNLVDRTIGSHWKTGKSKMTVDQIYQAATYFKVTVNDLFYSDTEKKKIAVLSDSTYDPIIAQQTLNVKLMSDSFKNPRTLIIGAILSFLIISPITHLLLKSSPYWFVVLLMGLLISKTVFQSTFAITKTLIVNYLDDIYYERDSHKNKFIIFQFIFRILSIIFIMYTISLIDLNEIDTTSNNGFIVAMYIIFVMLYLVIILMAFLFIDIKYSLTIYDHEVQGYITSFSIFVFSLLLISSASLLFTLNLNDYWLIVSMCISVSVLNLLDFLLVSRSYSNYKLMYEAEGKEPRQLFFKNIE